MADFEERIAALEAELDRTYRGIEFLRGELQREAGGDSPAEAGGVMSRECLRERLDVEVLRSLRHGIPLTLLMLRLDGPPDQAAALFERACAIVLENCRRTDLVGRGRDGEIVAGLFATSANGAKILAGRLLETLRESTSATCSIGISSLDAESRSLPQLVESARRSLGKAREKGGAQFHVSGEMPLAKRLWRAVVEFLKDPPRPRSTEI